jgi:hypothetical protein
MISRYVDDEYQPFAVLEGSGGVRLPIAVDRQRTATGLDVDTGWPCFRQRANPSIESVSTR